MKELIPIISIINLYRALRQVTSKLRLQLHRGYAVRNWLLCSLRVNLPHSSMEVHWLLALACGPNETLVGK